MEGMQPIQIEGIKEIDLLKTKIVEQISPLKIYLFGSYAEGRQTEDSDYDFYIVVRDDTRDMVETTAKAYQSIRHIKQRPVDILVGTNSRFEERKWKPTVENEVFTKGVLIYG